jgi:hypothetical protein
MIPIRSVTLPDHIDSALHTLQSDINKIVDYEARVAAAGRRFSTENRAGNATFDVIKGILSSMCSCPCRCMYCEDSAANEVEHFRPKSLFPELVFSWINYLYSCGPCNRAKLSHFRILISPMKFIDLAHSKRGTIIQPPIGTAVMIDPRKENPLDYMSLDLVDTFQFVPKGIVGTLEYARADYTITRLKLNERDLLPAARRDAYIGYRARLRDYVAVRDTGDAQYVQVRSVGADTPLYWQK